MSEIPFVKQLGDAIETAAASAPPRRRRSRRRLALYAAAGSLVLGGGAAAAASILFSSEEQATADIECYQGDSVERSVYQDPAVGRDPVEVCRETLGYGGRPVPPLVACAGDDTVAVIPGRSAEDCKRAGLAPLGAEYERYRAKVARLQRDVLALETSVDCLPPRAYAARLQRLLDRTGWVGWTAQLRDGRADGPCGTVTGRGGGIDRTVAGAFDGKAKVIHVRSDVSHTLDKLLVSTALRLFRRTGERCFTTAELTSAVRRAIAPAGAKLRVVVSALPDGGTIVAPRGTRYEEGCSVLGSVGPEPGEDGLVLRIARKG